MTSESSRLNYGSPHFNLSSEPSGEDQDLALQEPLTTQFHIYDRVTFI